MFKRHLYSHVHCAAFYNGQNNEVSISGWKMMWQEILFSLLKGDSVACTNTDEREDMLSEVIQAQNDALRSCFYVGSRMVESIKIDP